MNNGQAATAEKTRTEDGIILSARRQATNMSIAVLRPHTEQDTKTVSRLWRHRCSGRCIDQRESDVLGDVFLPRTFFAV